RWRACRPAPASARKWKSVASGTRYVWCSRPSCVTARYWCKFDRPFCATAVNSLEDTTMSDIPSDLRYAASHEWARLEADGSVTVGISDHAQEALGDVVYVELPELGRQLGA